MCTSRGLTKKHESNPPYSPFIKGGKGDLIEGFHVNRHAFRDTKGHENQAVAANFSLRAMIAQRHRSQTKVCGYSMETRIFE